MINKAKFTKKLHTPNYAKIVFALQCQKRKDTNYISKKQVFLKPIFYLRGNVKPSTFWMCGDNIFTYSLTAVLDFAICPKRPMLTTKSPKYF